MPAGFTGPLAKRLDGICELNVVEVSRPTALRAGCVLHRARRCRHRRIETPFRSGCDSRACEVNYPWHPSTDRLVRTAMDHVPANQLIGILMTGMGNDGAEAMALLRSNGGRTIAEAEETAVVWECPEKLVRVGGANWVIPLPKIAERLQKLVSNHAAHS